MIQQLLKNSFIYSLELLLPDSRFLMIMNAVEHVENPTFCFIAVFHEAWSP